jgi:hypothetical protein
VSAASLEIRQKSIHLVSFFHSSGAGGMSLARKSFGPPESDLANVVSNGVILFMSPYTSMAYLHDSDISLATNTNRGYPDGLSVTLPSVIIKT